MKSFAILTAVLATAVTAVDLHLQNWGGCNDAGGGWVCYGWNPNTCCSVNAGTFFASVSFRAIPGAWNLQCRGHAGPNCGSIREQQDSGGRDFVCLGSGPFGGSGYGFNNRKMVRGVTSGLAAREAEGQESAGCVAPNVMYLADGTQYNYTAILEAKLPTEELVALNKAGASAADVPEAFASFQLAEKLKL
ncbi:hypothetical protein PspLS_10742 [Pyricularia sp. CBS 133598]|nr:hypothetical protein PspLS_10742 [Pyricularia sp. CBS 133598]